MADASLDRPADVSSPAPATPEDNEAMAATRETMLIHGGRVYRHDGDTDNPPVADVLIRDGVIERLEPDLLAAQKRGDLGNVDRVIDARGKLLLPGFFNAHYHSHDTLQKGCFETPP